MTKNLLVELGLEELPAYVVTPSSTNKFFVMFFPLQNSSF